ncbi:MAG: DUF4854 domain-containing protein [Clostridia bacterium]|nr:DUF4854 domain-containing protein [Clostridia bacterium]
MKRLITAVSALMIVAMMLAFGGCGEPTKATLEDIASSNTELTKTIKDGIEVPQGTSAKVSFSGDSFDVTYTFDDAMDSDLEKRLVSSFDENADTLREGCESAIDDLQKQTEISGITGTIHILNADGKEIWSVSYPKQ